MLSALDQNVVDSLFSFPISCSSRCFYLGGLKITPMSSQNKQRKNSNASSGGGASRNGGSTKPLSYASAAGKVEKSGEAKGSRVEPKSVNENVEPSEKPQHASIKFGSIQTEGAYDPVKFASEGTRKMIPGLARASNLDFPRTRSAPPDIQEQQAFAMKQQQQQQQSQQLPSSNLQGHQNAVPHPQPFIPVGAMNGNDPMQYRPMPVHMPSYQSHQARFTEASFMAGGMPYPYGVPYMGGGYGMPSGMQGGPHQAMHSPAKPAPAQDAGASSKETPIKRATPAKKVMKFVDPTTGQTLDFSALSLSVQNQAKEEESQKETAKAETVPPSATPSRKSSAIPIINPETHLQIQSTPPPKKSSPVQPEREETKQEKSRSRSPAKEVKTLDEKPVGEIKREASKERQPSPPSKKAEISKDDALPTTKILSESREGSLSPKTKEKPKPPSLEVKMPHTYQALIPPSPSVEQGKKRVYNRDFLLAFMDKNTDRPPDLPDVEAMLGLDDHTGRSTPSGRSRHDSKTSSSGRLPMGSKGGKDLRSMSRPLSSRQGALGAPSGSGGRPGRLGSSAGSRPSRGGRNNDQITIAPEDIKPLEATENRWIPTTVTGEKLDKAAIVVKHMKALLNKLTLDNFDRITHQVMNVGIFDEVTLTGCIDLVFDKATDEPHYGSMYAKLCQQMSQELPPWEGFELYSQGGAGHSNKAARQWKGE